MAMLNGGAGLILENEQASRWLVTDETDTERPIDELANGIGSPANQDPGTIGGPTGAAEGGVTAGAGAMSVTAETMTAADGAAAKTIDGLSGVTRLATGGGESG